MKIKKINKINSWHSKHVGFMVVNSVNYVNFYYSLDVMLLFCTQWLLRIIFSRSCSYYYIFLNFTCNFLQVVCFQMWSERPLFVELSAFHSTSSNQIHHKFHHSISFSKSIFTVYRLDGRPTPRTGAAVAPFSIILAIRITYWSYFPVMSLCLCTALDSFAFLKG